MKIISASEMRRIEALCFQEQGPQWADDFMEAAGRAVARVVYYVFIKKFQKTRGSVLLLCAKGNNSGDAYVAGRHLLYRGFSVSAVQLTPEASASPLCQKHLQQFKDAGGKFVSWQKTQILHLDSDTVIVDGLLGTGFQGEVQTPYTELIAFANQSGLPIVAIDCPSGLDGNSGVSMAQAQQNTVIKAYITVVLGLAKTGYFFGQSWNYLGKLKWVDFGLSQSYVDQAQSPYRLLTFARARSLLPQVKANRHKYEAGPVSMLAGSPGMAGSAMLAGYAAMRAGSGYVRLVHPKSMVEEFHGSALEIVKFAYDESKAESEVLLAFDKAKALLLGPGLGQSTTIKNLLSKLLPQIQLPMVLDADALNLFADSSLRFTHPVIMTPHLGEMGRLLKYQGRLELSEKFLQSCQHYAADKQVIIVLKGAPTWIVPPQGEIHLCLRGDPGMATAGSGDVLAGIIVSLLAQGLSAQEAAMLGVYLHGRAGEKAAAEKTSYSMIASDLIEYLPWAFKFEEALDTGIFKDLDKEVC